MHKSWVSNLGYDNLSHKTRSRRGIPLLQNKRMHRYVLLLLVLLATAALGKKAADPRDDILGEEVDEGSDWNDGPNTTADFGDKPVLPFTEK